MEISQYELQGIINNASKKEHNVEEVKAKSQKKEEIIKEYTKLCTEAGEVQYRIKILQFHLDDLNNKILKLNNEANDINSEKKEEEFKKVNIEVVQ